MMGAWLYARACSLDGSKPSPIRVVGLAAALRFNRSITRLALQNIVVGREGTAALSAALAVNTSVATLELSHSTFEPEGWAAMADMLKASGTITALTCSMPTKRLRRMGHSWRRSQRR